MEFFEKYKKPIVAAGVGALTAIVLSYIVSIPFWVTGGLIGLITVFFTDQLVEITDKQVANLQAKRNEQKAKKSASNADES